MFTVKKDSSIYRVLFNLLRIFLCKLLRFSLPRCCCVTASRIRGLGHQEGREGREWEERKRKEGMEREGGGMEGMGRREKKGGEGKRRDKIKGKKRKWGSERRKGEGKGNKVREGEKVD